MLSLSKTIDKANGYIYGGFSEDDVMENMSLTLRKDFGFEKYPLISLSVFNFLGCCFNDIFF